jgi:hypothetical protein
MSLHVSFVYRHIFIYRAIMNLLYGGGYRERFDVLNVEIQTLRKQATVIELCFGDTYIAQFCRNHGYQWQGLDLNEHFVQEAKRQGFHAEKQDIAALTDFPKADMCIMVGSLYHFQNDAAAVLEKMFRCAPVVLLSEPVRNLSSRKGLVGWIARRAANAGKGHQQFRFTETSLATFLEDFSRSRKVNIVSKKSMGKDLVIKMTRT